jgi:hypothetical protein
MKFSSKFRLSTYVEKNINFSFCFKFFFGGVTKFEALQKAFVTKLNPPKPSPHTREPTCERPQTALHGRRTAPGRSPRPADGPRTFLAPKWPSLSLVPFKGPKKSQPTLKVSILTRGHLKGAQKVSAPFKSQDFHCPPLQMGRVMGFPV